MRTSTTATAALTLILLAGSFAQAQGRAPSGHPGDGIPDPAGRIAFGQYLGQSEDDQQMVKPFAIDPDGSDLVQLTDGDSGLPAWSPDGKRLAFSKLASAASVPNVEIVVDEPGINENHFSWGVAAP